MNILKYCQPQIDIQKDIAVLTFDPKFKYLHSEISSQLPDLSVLLGVRKIRFDYSTRKKIEFTKEIKRPEVKVTVEINPHENIFFKPGDWFALDLETDSENPLTCNVVGVGLTDVATMQTWYIPIAHTSGENCTEENLHLFFQNFLHSVNIVVHNLSFEGKILKRLGYDIKLWDTLIYNYLENSSHPKGLKDIVHRKYGVNMLTYDEVTDKGKISFADIDILKAAQYCGADSYFTANLHRDNTVHTELVKLDHRVAKVCSVMEEVGVSLDVDRLQIFGTELDRRLELIEKKMFELVGNEFNVRSHKQVADVIYEKLGVRKHRWCYTETGSLSTNDKTLRKLEAEGDKHPVLSLLSAHRQLTKLNTSYVKKLPGMVSEDGKLHARFLYFGTETGRLSSASPNLQNIPAHGFGKEIRRCIIPSPGFIFTTADYSQIELRILAHIMNDPQVLELFVKGYDLHAATAAAIYDRPIESIDKNSFERTVGKTLNFALIYGQSAKSTADQLSIGTAGAEKLIEKYFQRFPIIGEKIAEAVNSCKVNGYVETLLGRKRWLPNINSPSEYLRAEAERQTFNHIIQGTAAEVARCAMIRIAEEVLPAFNNNARLVMQVHDEFVSEVLISLESEYNGALESVMKDPFTIDGRRMLQLRVPLSVDIGTAKNYGDSK